MTASRIRLPRDGVEYAHFTFTAPLADGVQLEAQIGGIWYPLDQTVVPPRLLLRGPDTDAGSPGVLVANDQAIRVRVRNVPEHIVRGAGYVVLVR